MRRQCTLDALAGYTEYWYTTHWDMVGVLSRPECTDLHAHETTRLGYCGRSGLGAFMGFLVCTRMLTVMCARSRGGRLGVHTAASHSRLLGRDMEQT